MDKTVSFIIPSYNVEKYIAKCLDSFIEKDLLNYIEVLVVNDGSTDQTSFIAHKYEKKYQNVFKVFDKENGGHGSTINFGVQHASGKYIKVIDADDWVDTKELSNYVRKLQEVDADIVLTHFNTFDIKSKTIIKHSLRNVNFGTNNSLLDIMRNFNDYDECLCFHGITYSLKYYLSCNIHLSEHVFYEDNEYSTFPFYKAQKIVSIDTTLYQYRVGDVEQSVSIQSRVKRLDDEKKVIDNMLDFYKKYVNNEAVLEYFNMKISRVLVSHWITCLLAYSDRKAGKNRARELYQKLNDLPELKKTVEKKYMLLRIASNMHMSFQSFMNIIEISKKRRFK